MVLAKVNLGGSCGCLYMLATVHSASLFSETVLKGMKEAFVCPTTIKAIEESFACSPQCLKGSKVFGKYERDMSAG